MKISTKLIFLMCCVITFQNFQFLFAQITEQKILPVDGAEGDSFGNSVSIASDYSIVGAFSDDTGQGSAYIFKRDGTSWAEEQKLSSSDGTAGDRFGRSVSISGDYVIVGAYTNDNGLLSGSAYIFRRVDTTWIEEQKLIPSDGAADDRFGTSVAISGDYALVGAYGDDDNGDWTGSAYIFKREGTNWIEVQKLLASDRASFNYFGWSVSISGDYALVGAYWGDSGRAYIFRRDSTAWIEEQKLTASDGAHGDQFGWSVSISGDYALVSSSADENGSAYVFKRDGTSWTEEQKLTASDSAPGDRFGSSVSISGDYSIISAIENAHDDQGSAYIYSGISSIVEIELTRPNGGENFIIGSNETILWDSYNITDMKIEYSINNGASWILIVNLIPATEGNYLWKVPNTPSVQSKVRISDNGNPNIFDISEGVFTISPVPIPVINLLYPNGGEQLYHGDTLTISWSSQYIDNIKIEFSQDNGFDWLSILDSIPASNNQHQWIIPDSITSDQGLIRICDINNLQICDESDSVFSIEQFQDITILTPNGGEVWPQGITEDIFWTSENVIDVKIELSIDNGASWTTVVDSTPSTGIYSWLVNATQPSTQCLIKISDVTDENTSDQSDDVFTIDVVPGVDDHNSGIPVEYVLLQNFPNPFNPVTTIYYGLPDASSVEIKIFDILGKEWMNFFEEEQAAGYHRIKFNAIRLPSGVYFYQIKAGSFVETKKMLLIK